MKPRLDVDLALVDTPQAWAYAVLTVHQPWPRRRRLLGIAAALSAIMAVALFPILTTPTTRPSGSAAVHAEEPGVFTRAVATLHEALCVVGPLQEHSRPVSSGGTS
jgi:hypothetical protein